MGSFDSTKVALLNSEWVRVCWDSGFLLEFEYDSSLGWNDSF